MNEHQVILSALVDDAKYMNAVLLGGGAIALNTSKNSPQMRLIAASKAKWMVSCGEQYSYADHFTMTREEALHRMLYARRLFANFYNAFFSIEGEYEQFCIGGSFLMRRPDGIAFMYESEGLKDPDAELTVVKAQLVAEVA